MRSYHFQLEKTYLDCIDANGNCFIAYRARIRYFFLTLNYSAVIFSAQQGPTKEFSSFKKTAVPVIGHELKFANPQFRFSGNWISTDDPIRLVLYTNSKGRELIWDCHHPKSNTVIAFGDLNFAGYGYAETISLPFAPQRLPIDELRWGRFLSQQHTIIWILWNGSHPINKIFCDGKLFEDGIFNEDGIAFYNNQYVLEFEEVVALTKRKLSSFFNTVPFLKIFFGRRLLNTEEKKYKAHAIFTSYNSISDKGFALFETVRFKE